MSDIDEEINLEDLSIEDVQEILAENAVKIYKLEKKVKDLEETARKREDWLRKAKEEAGYNMNISFDVVWKDVLNRSKL